MSHTLFLVDPEAKQLADLKVWEPEVAVEEEVKPVAKTGMPSKLYKPCKLYVPCKPGSALYSWSITACRPDSGYLNGSILAFASL